MSRKNVEIVRSVYEATARGDTASVLGFYDAAVEYDFSGSPFSAFVERRTYHGHEGLRRFFRERNEAWRTLSDDYEELIDAGEHVISVVVSRGRGRASGAEVERTHFGLWTISDGKIVRVAWFASRAEAFEAAGAGPQP